MALTAQENQALIDAGLTDFFESHRALYKDMAKKAYMYSKGAVEKAGLPVRVDDVIQALSPPLEIEPTLRDYLGEARLTQKYWPKRFGNYVLDQLWEELTNAAEKPASSTGGRSLRRQRN